MSQGNTASWEDPAPAAEPLGPCKANTSSGFIQSPKMLGTKAKTEGSKGVFKVAPLPLAGPDEGVRRAWLRLIPGGRLVWLPVWEQPKPRDIHEVLLSQRWGPSC